MHDIKRTTDEIVDSLTRKDDEGFAPVSWVLSALHEINDRGPRAHDPDPGGYLMMHQALFQVMYDLRELHLRRYGGTVHDISIAKKPIGPVDRSRRKAEIELRNIDEMIFW